MIIAHRGYKKEHPENTFGAFDAAFSAGADAIETDLNLASDGNIVVSHDPVQSSKGLITLDELFEYINRKTAPFFLELKSPSPVLLANVIKKIHAMDLWEQVHLIGFIENIKTALAVQKHFPKLLVDQILKYPIVDQIIKYPIWGYIKKPQKSNALYIGWLDDIPKSEPMFRSIFSEERLTKFKNHFQNKGFKVYAGVLNRDIGINYFLKAGINDIFTDEVETAVLCHKQQQQS